MSEEEKYVVEIEEQRFEYDSLVAAQLKAKELLDSGLWYIRLRMSKKKQEKKKP